MVRCRKYSPFRPPFHALFVWRVAVFFRRYGYLCVCLGLDFPLGRWLMIRYHVVAFLTVAVWGTTFVWTRLLIDAGLSPAQIFTLRFALAYVLLLAFSLVVRRGAAACPRAAGRGARGNRAGW